MKEGIHPKWYPDAKVMVEGEVVMTVGSTQPELRVEIWSGTHPFYTGTQRLVDTEGQVDRFMKRLQRKKKHVLLSNFPLTICHWEPVQKKPCWLPM